METHSTPPHENGHLNHVDEPGLSVMQKILRGLKLDVSTFQQKLDGLSPFQRVLDKNRIIAHRTRDKNADTFRFLRTQVLRSMQEHDLKTLAITSPHYGDGKSTTAVNLAVSIAQDLKQTVLLIDLDLRQPSLAEYLDLPPEVGITNYLQKTASVQDCLVKMPFNRIRVFPAGQPVDNSSEIIGSPQMEKLAGELKERYDDRMIIYDLPPLLEQDDPLVFIKNVDGFLMVVKEGETTVNDLHRSLSILEDAKVLGIVLNAV
jgi:capsular exopolysaccharide synthesis family protein